MGIVGLHKFIKDKCPDAIQDVDVEKLKGKSFGIDISKFMYKYQHTGAPPVHEMEQLHDYLIKKIGGKTVIFIFDGPSHPIKINEKERRKEKSKIEAKKHVIRKEIKSSLSECLGDETKMDEDYIKNEIISKDNVPVDIKKLFQDHTEIVVDKKTNTTMKRKFQLSYFMDSINDIIMKRENSNCIDEDGEMRIPDYYYTAVMEMFKEKNIHFMIAPHDAEQLGAQLLKSKQIDYFLTDDGDTLCFGAPHILKNFPDHKSGNTNSKIILLDEILSTLNIDLQQFIDMCVICGCDYLIERGGLPGLGPVKALKIVKSYSSIKTYLDTSTDVVKFLRKKPDYDLERDFNYVEARNVFMESDIVPKYDSMNSDDMPTEVRETKKIRH